MNGYGYRKSAAAQRYADRHQRENEAPRLLQEIPNLVSLRLTVEAHATGSGGGAAAPPYIRHVVVASAPALFFVGCGDSNCDDGGCDITDLVMYALRAGRTSFDGERSCQGMVGSAGCTRVVRFVGEAAYRKG